MAGVASNADLEAIMIYNDRSNYSEWEFIFDPTKWRVPPNPLGGGVGIPASPGSQSSMGTGGAPGTVSSPGQGTGSGTGAGGGAGIGGRIQ